MGVLDSTSLLVFSLISTFGISVLNWHLHIFHQLHMRFMVPIIISHGSPCDLQQQVHLEHSSDDLQLPVVTKLLEQMSYNHAQTKGRMMGQ